MVKAAADKSVYCVAFYLQKVLDTPSAEAGPLYYKRKLSVYNLTVIPKRVKLSYLMRRKDIGVQMRYPAAC